MPAAITYARVSTTEQKEKGYSLPEQLTECRLRAEELGARQILEFQDDVSGELLERPGLDAAREAIRAGGISWFVCLAPDRFSRELFNQLLITREIEHAGTQLVFVQANYEKTAEGRLFYAMSGAIAEYEKAKILERTSRGKRGKAKRGLLPGYFDAYGYSFNPATDTLDVDPTEAPWVEQIFRWAAAPDPAARLGPSGIAARMNQLGVPAPRGVRWYRSTVRDLVRNPLYTGTLFWGRRRHAGTYLNKRRPKSERAKPVERPRSEWTAIPVPPLISGELFEEAQRWLDRSRHLRCSSEDRQTYLLTGLARCGVCGAPMQHRQNSLRQRYWLCSRRYPQGRGEACSLGYVPAEGLEGHVWEVVSGWVRRPDFLYLYLSGEEQGVRDGSELEERLIREQITEAESMRQRVFALSVRGRVPLEMSEAELERIGGTIARLQARLGQLGQPLPADPPGDLGELDARLQGRLEALPAPGRQRLVRMLVERVTVRGREPEGWIVSGLDQDNHH